MSERKLYNKKDGKTYVKAGNYYICLDDQPDVADLAEISEYKCRNYIEESCGIADALNRDWKVKDVITVPLKDGRQVDFRVEHIENGKVYFVSVDLLGKSKMNNTGKNNSMPDMDAFLDNLEAQFPDELLAEIQPMELIDDKITSRRKISLLSVANVLPKGKLDEIGVSCSGADDVFFSGLTTEAERCKNLNGGTYYYWLRSPGVSNSTYFWGVGAGGSVYYHNAANTIAVCAAWSISARK